MWKNIFTAPVTLGKIFTVEWFDSQRAIDYNIHIFTLNYIRYAPVHFVPFETSAYIYSCSFLSRS
jgi:hypothetical protein